MFLPDLHAHTTTLVSRGDGIHGVQSDGDGSFDSSVSADGQFVTFESFARNLGGLGPDSARDNSDVFVRDMRTTATMLVSRADGPDGAPANGSTSLPGAISADGRHRTRNAGEHDALLALVAIAALAKRSSPFPQGLRCHPLRSGV